MAQAQITADINTDFVMMNRIEYQSTLISNPFLLRKNIFYTAFVDKSYFKAVEQQIFS
jgi:hypothetical protein